MIKLTIRTLHQFLPRGIRTHRIWGGMLRGERIVTSWQDYPAGILGYTERHLLDWFRQNVKPGQTWMDIGAHYGFTAIALSRLVGSEGRVFAFEPMLSTAGYLGRTRRLNKLSQLIVIPFGLAAPDTLDMISLPAIRGMADSTIMRNMKDIENVKWLERNMVARFDWLWPMICGAHNGIDGVKIDVQGMETEVLTGMLESLRSHHPKLVVEFHRGVDRERLLQIIELAGYARRALPIEPINGEQSPLYADDHSYIFSKHTEGCI